MKTYKLSIVTRLLVSDDVKNYKPIDQSVWQVDLDTTSTETEWSSIKELTKTAEAQFSNMIDHHKHRIPKESWRS